MLTVILAGGASRRMGRDKAMLPYGNTTLLQTLIHKYQALGPVAVSVNQAGKYTGCGVPELVDRYPDWGPMNGLLSAFSETDAEEVFLTAVDLPFGDPELVQRIAALRGNADVSILKRGKKGVEPLFAVYGRSCAAAAERCLNAGKKSMFDLLESTEQRLILPDELPEFDLEHILRNVNTPEDYAAIRPE